MARKANVSMLAELNAGAATQEIKKGMSGRTDDPRFPAFSTPINTDIMVYFPRTNVVQTENGSVMNLLTVHTHSYKDGKFTNMLRCIRGLSGGAYNELGYDGTCPACDATSECWDLYNTKLKQIAKSLGVDPQNDPGEVLKAHKRELANSRAIDTTEEYVTFPIVIIPFENGAPVFTQEAVEAGLFKVEFVTWRKSRYEKNILSPLADLSTNPGHPGGTFWMWKFTYDTKGKPATARDSAREAKYTLILEPARLNACTPHMDYFDSMAVEFTNEKAVDTIYSHQYLYKEDLDAKVNKIMASTRQMLEIADVETLPSQATGALANFGGALGVEAPTAPPVSFANPAPVAPATPVAPVAPVAPAAPTTFGATPAPSMGVSSATAGFGFQV